MTITQADEADLLVRFAHVTEGPVMAVEDPCDGRDYKVAVEKLDRAGCVGVVICRAEHDWEYSRLSWKTAEANADYIAWAITNRLEIISAFTHREASEAPLKEQIAQRDARIAVLEETLWSLPNALEKAATEAVPDFTVETPLRLERIASQTGVAAGLFRAVKITTDKINTLLGEG